MQITGGATALMYACQQCKEMEVLDILKNQPLAVKERDRTLKTPLHYCAENPNTSCAEAILKASPELVNALDENGYSPLHLAVIAGNKPLIKVLIAKGVDVNVHDGEGHSAVHWSIVSSEKEALEMIIRAGADPSTPDIHGGYPLHYAVQMCGSNGDHLRSMEDAVRVVETLINFGVDVNVKDKDGRQPILWAASAGSADAVIHLVSAGACVEAADKDGLTALHCAASRGHTTTLETLITLCGANVDVIDGNGCSALFYSVTLGHADATELLLRLGAEPNRQDRKGRTPAHCGAAKGQLETLRILQKHGGNLWMRNVKGDIPLHEAVASGRKDLVLWLLSQNPDAINLANNDGRCALHIASMYNNTEMVKILLDAKSLVNPVMRTSKGVLMTPLNVALCKGHRSCGKYLQLHGGVPFSKVSKTEIRLTSSHEEKTSSQVQISKSRSSTDVKENQEKPESGDKKKVYRRRKKKKNLNVNNEDSDTDDSKSPEGRKSTEEDKVKVKRVRMNGRTETLQRAKSFNETKNVSDLSPEDFPPLMQTIDHLDAVIMEPDTDMSKQESEIEMKARAVAENETNAESRALEETTKESKNAREKEARDAKENGTTKETTGGKDKETTKEARDAKEKETTKEARDAKEKETTKETTGGKDKETTKEARDAKEKETTKETTGGKDKETTKEARNAKEKETTKEHATNGQEVHETITKTTVKRSTTKTDETSTRKSPKSKTSSKKVIVEEQVQKRTEVKGQETSGKTEETKSKSSHSSNDKKSQTQTNGEETVTKNNTQKDVNAEEEKTVEETKDSQSRTEPVDDDLQFPKAEESVQKEGDEEPETDEPKSKTKRSKNDNSVQESQKSVNAEEAIVKESVQKEKDVQEEETNDKTEEPNTKSSNDSSPKSKKSKNGEGTVQKEQEQEKVHETDELKTKTERSDEEKPKTQANAEETVTKERNQEEMNVETADNNLQSKNEVSIAQTDTKETRDIETSFKTNESTTVDDENVRKTVEETKNVETSSKTNETTVDDKNFRKTVEENVQKQEASPKTTADESKKSTNEKSGKSDDSKTNEKDKPVQSSLRSSSKAENDQIQPENDQTKMSDQEMEDAPDVRELLTQYSISVSAMNKNQALREQTKVSETGSNKKTDEKTEEVSGNFEKSFETVNQDGGGAEDKPPMKVSLESKAMKSTPESIQTKAQAREHQSINEEVQKGDGYTSNDGENGAGKKDHKAEEDEKTGRETPNGDADVTEESSKKPEVKHEKTPKVSRLCRRHREYKQDMSQISVTQLVQNTIRKYHMERGIFYQLLELKRYQIRSGKANEQVLVKRLADDYERSRVFLGMKPFSGVYKFKEFEKFLYDQLKALNVRRSYIIPEVKSYDDIDALSGFLKKSRYKIIGDVPQPQMLCTCITQRCHHSACAYTSVPCSAYITDLRRHKHHKPKRECFFPRIEQPGEKTEEQPATLELIQGSQKHVITLPKNSPSKGKRYYVTFTIKGASGYSDESGGENSRETLKHRHAKSV